MVYYGGSSVNLTALRVIRPAKYEVTFNMHGHGDAVDAQTIINGGTVSEPATTDITGWDFGGWYKEDTYENEWDFDNDVVNAVTELHAKWTAHVASTDATLKDLTVGGVTVAGFDPATEEYNVVLEMGTTAAPAVSGTANDANATSVVVMQTVPSLDDATVTVTAENTAYNKTYTIHFTVATSKDIQLVFKTGTTPCVGSASTTTQILSNNAAVSTYINQITFTNVEGSGDDGAEGSSLNVGKKAGNMFTLSAKPGYALQSMNFLAKIQDATCEYSINGGAWTTLTSTDTGADECYAPFSAAEVHEFRLRSTGAEGVWIRNMQLTIVEACTPITLAWDEEPVEFEVGKSGYAIASTANNSGAVTYSSTDGDIIAVNAETGALTVSALGAVALKAATAEGDGTTYCANGGNPIEISKTVNTYYLVEFDAQNETSVSEVKYFSGDAAIDQPAEPSYSGFDFQGWFDAATGGNPIAWPLTPAASMTVYAQWQAQCDGPSIDVQPVSANYLTGRAATALNCEATAGAGGALTYTWYSCDDAMRTNPVELAGAPTPSTAAAGTFYFYCAVTEAGCGKIVNSNVATIVVTDKDGICIIKVATTGGTNKTVTGLYAEDGVVNIAGDKKFGGSGQYIGMMLQEGKTFDEGDIINVHTTTAAGQGTIAIYSNSGKTATQVYDFATMGVAGNNKFALPAAVEDMSTLYVCRTDANNWNGYVDYIEVTRACAPILNKITVNGVEGAPVANVVTMDVPASTTQSQLEAIAYDWISNNDEWTAAHTPVAANAWEFGVANTVTLTDKDGDESVYTITVNKAAASTNIELATLTVNGNAVTVVPGQYTYAYELPYGTSAVPVVVATAADANANVGAVTANINSATFTVTAEDGTTAQLYTVNFSVSKWAEVVIWDGSYMSAVKTVEEADIVSWAVTGFGSIDSYNTTYGEKSYSKYLPSGGSVSATRNIALTVPAGYVAKFYVVMATHSDTKERGMFIGSNLVKDPDATSILELSNNDRDEAVAGMSEIAGAGTYYINPNASVDFQEIRVYLRKGMVRNSMLGDGVLGTSCVDHNVAIEDIQGATFYELMGRDYSNSGKLAFDEIVSGELEAGAPYVFQAHGDKLVLFYGDTKVDDPVDKGNGMYGTFTAQTLTELDDVYYFAQRALWSCVDLSSLSVPANRAYVKLSEVGEVQSSTPNNGRRRITMTVNGEKVATDVENLEASEQPVKLMINGQIFILRGEKMYDATGRLVK